MAELTAAWSTSVNSKSRADGGVAAPVRGAQTARAAGTAGVSNVGKPADSADCLIDHLWGDGEAGGPGETCCRLRSASCAAAWDRRRSSPLKSAMPWLFILMMWMSFALSSSSPPDGASRRRVRRRRDQPRWARRWRCGGGSRWGSSPMPASADVELLDLDESTLVAIEARAGADLQFGFYGIARRGTGGPVSANIHRASDCGINATLPCTALGERPRLWPPTP